MTVIRCKYCKRQFADIHRYVAHLSAAHDDRAEVAGPDSEHPTSSTPNEPDEPTSSAPKIIWEDPPALGRHPEIEPRVRAALPELLANPGRWARIALFGAKTSASTKAAQLRPRFPELEFRGSVQRGGTSALYVRAPEATT